MGITPDFQVLYLAAKDFFAGLNFYQNSQIFTGVGYPPNTLLFYFPFTLLEYNVAQTLFFIFSFITSIISILLILKLVVPRPKLWHSLLALALTLLSFPTKFTFGMGQNNFVAFLLLIISFYAYTKKKIPLAGIFLGLSISFKTIFSFFFLFFLLKKEFKLIFYGLMVMVLLFLISMAVGGIGLYGYYFQSVVPPLLNLSGREIYYDQGLIGFISRLTIDNYLRRILWEIGSIVLIGIASFLTIKKGGKILLFSLFVTTLPLIDSLSWQHHFVWLIFPFIVLVRAVIKSKSAVLLTLIGLAYIFVGWNFKNPNLFPALLLSNQFYGAIILWGLNLYFLVKNQSKTTKADKGNTKHKIFGFLNLE